MFVTGTNIPDEEKRNLGWRLGRDNQFSLVILSAPAATRRLASTSVTVQPEYRSADHVDQYG